MCGPLRTHQAIMRRRRFPPRRHRKPREALGRAEQTRRVELLGVLAAFSEIAWHSATKAAATGGWPGLADGWLVLFKTKEAPRRTLLDSRMLVVSHTDG